MHSVQSRLYLWSIFVDRDDFDNIHRCMNNTVYTVQCTVYSEQLTLYTVHCIVYTVSCIVHTEYTVKSSEQNTINVK